VKAWRSTATGKQIDIDIVSELVAGGSGLVAGD